MSTFQYQAVGYRANFGVGNGMQWGGYIDGSAGSRTMVGSINGQSARLYLKNYVSSEANAVLCDGTCRDAFHTYEIQWRAGNSLARMDHGAASATLTVQVPTVSLPVTFYSFTASGAILQVDWVYVRQYRFPEPAAQLGAPQGAVDLQVTKTGAPDPVRAGEPLTYTILVANNSLEVAAGVVMTDVLPAGSSLVSVSAGQGTCTEGGTVVCALGSVAGSGTVEITLVITSTVEGEITNTAMVDSDSYELDATDNQATEATTVLPSADLWLDQLDEPDPVVAGHQLTYTIVVHNSGPTASADITLTDVLPASVDFVSAEPAVYCAQSSPVVCSLPGLPASGMSQVQVVVATAVDGLITNTVTVAASSYDPDLENNSSEEGTLVVTSADLSITQVDQPDPVLAEQELTYILTVHNAGPSIAANIRLTDTLPGGVILVSATPDQGSCTPGSWVTCDLGYLENGANAEVRVVVVPQAAGNIANTVTVVMDTPESNLANNTDTETTGVLPLSADLDLSLSDAPDPALAGGTLTYTVQVANLGPSRAINPSVTIELASQVTFLVSTPGAPACTETAGVVTCTLDEIASGGSAEVTLVVQVAPSVLYGTQIQTQAQVASAVGDPVPGNNHDDVETVVHTQADLSLEVIDTPDPVAPGTQLIYTIVYANNGPSDAIGLTLTDYLPGDVDYHLASPDVCDLRPFNPIVDCDLYPLPAGESAQLVLVVTVKLTALQPFTNVISLSANTPDLNLDNNLGQATTSIDNAAPDLQWKAPIDNDLDIYAIVLAPGQSITLTAIATDPSGIARVRFTRWDHVRLVYVEICEDEEGISDEYSCLWTSLNPLELPPGPNAVYAYAYDTAGNWMRKRIWLISPYSILPLIMK
jgi:uncharacterized repeat protein (TIGR01451 family)